MWVNAGKRTMHGSYWDIVCGWTTHLENMFVNQLYNSYFKGWKLFQYHNLGAFGIIFCQPEFPLYNTVCPKYSWTKPLGVTSMKYWFVKGEETWMKHFQQLVTYVFNTGRNPTRFRIFPHRIHVWYIYNISFIDGMGPAMWFRQSLHSKRDCFDRCPIPRVKNVVGFFLSWGSLWACMKRVYDQWSFLVPLIGGRYRIVSQLAIYKWYILPIGGIYGTYHLWREPGNNHWYEEDE